MDAVQILPTSVSGQVMGTIKAFMPKLMANAEDIKSVRMETHKFGFSDRHHLDVFYPDTTTNTKPKILFFLYGGGLVSGDRSHPAARGSGLVYQNIGRYFSQAGYILIIPDYRLVPSITGTAPEGSAASILSDPATYPSGAVDLQLAIHWVCKNLKDVADVDSIHLSGNSGGGLHLASYLLDDTFFLAEEEEVRKSILSIIFLSAVLDVENCPESRKPILEAYFGPEEDSLVRLSAKGCLSRLSNEQVSGLPKILSLVGERDPEDEIIEPNAAWWKDWIAKGGKGEATWFNSSGGRHHNHISYLWALKSGEGEEWGKQVIDFIES